MEIKININNDEIDKLLNFRKENNEVDIDIEYDENYIKDRVEKHINDLRKIENHNNKSRNNRRSYNIFKLIQLQRKITDVILDEKNEFDISDESIDTFIRNQKHIRFCIGENQYLETSPIASKLNDRFKTIELLINEKVKYKQKELKNIYDKEIERIEGLLKEEVREILKSGKY